MLVCAAGQQASCFFRHGAPLHSAPGQWLRCVARTPWRSCCVCGEPQCAAWMHAPCPLCVAETAAVVLFQHMYGSAAAHGSWLAAGAFTSVQVVFTLCLSLGTLHSLRQDWHLHRIPSTLALSCQWHLLMCVTTVPLRYVLKYLSSR